MDSVSSMTVGDQVEKFFHKKCLGKSLKVQKKRNDDNNGFNLFTTSFLFGVSECSLSLDKCLAPSVSFSNYFYDPEHVGLNYWLNLSHTVAARKEMFKLM